MSYTCSTPRSTSGISIANSETRSVIDDANEYDKHLLHEGIWMLSGNLEVVSPGEFLKIHFEEKELLKDDSVLLKNYTREFRKIKLAELKHEKDMYNLLVKPINSVLSGCKRSGDSYKCYRRDGKRSIAGHDAGIKVSLAPDLVITPNIKNLDKKATVFSQPMIAIEVKAHQWYNPTLRAGTDIGDEESNNKEHLFGPVTDATNLTDSQKKLIFQMMRYAILGQFGTLPYRHLFFITITGRKLRIWKFSPTGCLVTSTIDYLTEVECKPFVRFLYAIGSGPISHFGVDMGNGMMFQEVSEHPQNEKIQRRMDSVRKLYCEQSKDIHWEKHLSTEPGYWLFRLDVPSKNRYKRTTPIAQGSSKENFIEPGPRTNPKLEKENDGSSKEGVILVVFRRPIFRANHIFSRATRCYLGIELDFLISPQFKRASPIEKLQKMHTLKTAWQFVSRTPEAEFHRRFIERRMARMTMMDATESHDRMDDDSGPSNDGDKDGDNFSRVVTVLAGGIVPNSYQFKGRLVSDDPPDESQPIQTDRDHSTILHQSRAQESQSQSESQGTQTQTQLSNGGKEFVHTNVNNGGQGGLFSRLTAKIRSRRPEKTASNAAEIPIDVKQEYLDALVPIPPLPQSSSSPRQPPGSREHDHHQDEDQVGDEKSQPRELHWLVYKEVGGRLGAVGTVKEFAQVMIDILHAHRSLYDEDILHRDISGNNIMVDLATLDPESNTRRGLLIDLDVAKDLRETAEVSQEEKRYDGLKTKLLSMDESHMDGATADMQRRRRPEITGTLHWMSIALCDATKHRAWHDIESVFWVIVYYTLRHVEGITYGMDSIISPMDRAQTIDAIFRQPTATSPGQSKPQSISEIFQAKKSFLDLLFDVTSCKALGDVIGELQVAFRDFYDMLLKIDRIENDIRRLESNIPKSGKPLSANATRIKPTTRSMDTAEIKMEPTHNNVDTNTTTRNPPSAEESLEWIKPHYSANGLSDIVDHLSSLSRRVLENQLSENDRRKIRWNKVLGDVKRALDSVQDIENQLSISTAPATSTFIFPTYELVLEKLQMVLMSEEAERATFIPFEPPPRKTVPAKSRRDHPSDTPPGVSRKRPRSISRPPPNVGQEHPLDEVHAEGHRKKRHHK